MHHLMSNIVIKIIDLERFIHKTTLGWQSIFISISASNLSIYSTPSKSLVLNKIKVFNVRHYW